MKGCHPALAAFFCRSVAALGLAWQGISARLRVHRTSLGKPNVDRAGQNRKARVRNLGAGRASTWSGRRVLASGDRRVDASGARRRRCRHRDGEDGSQADGPDDLGGKEGRDRRCHFGPCRHRAVGGFRSGQGRGEGGESNRGCGGCGQRRRRQNADIGRHRVATSETRNSGESGSRRSGEGGTSRSGEAGASRTSRTGGSKGGAGPGEGGPTGTRCREAGPCTCRREGGTGTGTSETRCGDTGSGGGKTGSSGRVRPCGQGRRKHDGRGEDDERKERLGRGRPLNGRLPSHPKGCCPGDPAQQRSDHRVENEHGRTSWRLEISCAGSTPSAWHVRRDGLRS